MAGQTDRQTHHQVLHTLTFHGSQKEIGQGKLETGKEVEQYSSEYLSICDI